MFKIGICDDNSFVCTEIKGYIEEFFMTENIKHEIDVFISGEELIQALRCYERFDLLYLDIELEILNGVEVSRYIRENLMDENAQIAFISAKSSYVLELFQFRPINFLVKPFTKKQVLEVLEKALQLQGNQTKVFHYTIGKNEKTAFYKDIVYFSSDAKKIVLHMQNEEDYFYGKLLKLVLPTEDFVCIHKSYIVNRHYVMQFKFDSVVLHNAEILPISRAYRKEVREKLKMWQKGDM